MDITYDPVKGVMLNGIVIYKPIEAPAPAVPKIAVPSPIAVPEIAAPIDVLLPANTRHFEDKGNYIKLLIEIRPGISLFRFNLSNLSHISDVQKALKGLEKQALRKNTIEVAKPWQYFWLHFQKPYKNTYGFTYGFHGAQLFWAQERIVDLNSPVYPAQLPNICLSTKDYYAEFGLGTVCWGSFGNIPKSKPLAESAEDIVNLFYDNWFSAAMNNKWPVPYKNTSEWVKQTKKNPFCWMECEELTKAKTYPLAELLAKARAKYG